MYGLAVRRARVYDINNDLTKVFVLMYAQDKLQIKMYLSIIIIMASAVHAVMAFYFAFTGVTMLFILSAADIFIYAIAYLINRSGKTRIASFAFILKILTYSLVTTFLFGTNVNVHWFVLLAILPTSLYLDFNKVERIVIIASMPLLINLQLLFPYIYPTPFNMENDRFLEFFFANIIALGLIVEVTIDSITTIRINQLQERNAKAFQDMSNLDPLTRLYNRRFAEQFFDKMIGSGQDLPCLLCMIDIDEFKNVNDTYGHDMGDKVLQVLAELLRKNTRQSDLVCRWGGEEFLLGMPGCDLEIGRDIMEKIRKKIEDEVIPAESSAIRITVTGGMGVLEDDNLKQILDECDKKLYEGKRSGRNKIVA